MQSVGDKVIEHFQMNPFIQIFETKPCKSVKEN